MGAVRTKAFPSEPESAAAARHWMEAAAAEVEWDGSVEEAVLCVSELVTNSLRHAGAEVRVTLYRRGAALWVLVKDAGPGSVVRKHALPTDVSGRGLEIVERVSSTWGVMAETDGKAVWFEMSPST